ncbi:TIGR04222 domain-containing membrane protein [Saccharothrix obliqua]|uniref:TIGR04222 domain-containing membrane protein n=1 Tax=Saccharothrix obliqua TaxID=2861747 RepID=UPI001C5EF3EE|nr:TIGR04222 domain-containing membrane protein [Saccharothrix obliqua]MBW4717479.1 TIGR04222 domain-containing membrane protein [Saccharothrix obliqua]
MAASRVSAAVNPAVGLRAEELGFLAGGPGRAAEVAVVSLLASRSVRVSREGLVSPVRQVVPGTPLEALVLRSLPRPLGELVAAVARGPEVGSLRRGLVERGLARSAAVRSAVAAVRVLVLVDAFVLFVLAMADVVAPWVFFAGLIASLTAVVVLGRVARPLTASGRAAVRWSRGSVTTRDWRVLVACHGLLGRYGGRPVWEVVGIARTASATLKRRRAANRSGGGSSCGGCGSSSDGGSSCGGGDSSCGGGCGGGGGD